ncbi:MAG TPA: hypothetical protein VMB75_04810, partial [Rhodocyclaceae bacterium]|nr:hypothetical protein [Rhodocyclaceae bacterium]
MSPRDLLVLILLVPLLAWSQAYKQVAPKTDIYCCEIEGGKRLCGSPMPPQCLNRARREMTPGGTVKQIAAPLTPEQKAEQEAEAARKKDEEQKALEQRRHDSALVASYASEKDIDTKRDKALAQANHFLKQAEDRYADTLKAKQQLDNEAEFYLKKPMPAQLQAQIKKNKAEVTAQQGVVDQRKQDIENIRARFEQEKKRYIELTGGDAAAA